MTVALMVWLRSRSRRTLLALSVGLVVILGVVDF
jgi:hypothetical protein